MENKNKFWKGALVGALLTAFTGLIIVGMSLGIFLIGKAAIRDSEQALELASKPARVNQEESLDLKAVSKKLGTLQDIINQYYLFDEDSSRVEDWIYKGMMYGLKDPYSVYYTADEYKRLSEDTKGAYHGIGVMISQNKDTGIISVIRVFKNTPAQEAGMKPGDVLYKVGDEEVTGMDMDLLVKDYIKGKDGTNVKLTVFRKDSGQYVDLTMERRGVEVQSVDDKMLAGQVGYILVSQFDVVTGDQFKKAVDELEGQGMQKLVIDLRNNPGGVLDTAVTMMDYILPDDLTIEGDKALVRDHPHKTLLVYTADKHGKGLQYYAADDHQVTVPIAVLVNGESASASEVFTGAMKDYHKAVIVGTKTFGKGIVQNLIPLDNGTAIKLTTAHYYTPTGFDLHGKGIEPDVKVELKEELKTKVAIEPADDNQLQEAIKALDQEKK